MTSTTMTVWLDNQLIEEIKAAVLEADSDQLVSHGVVVKRWKKSMHMQ